MTTDVEMRAYRFALDLTPRQEQQMREHAGAARWAYNYALAQKYAALSQRQQAIAAMINAGIPAKLAAANAPRIPNKQAIQKALNRAKGDDRLGIPGDCPWWHTVSTYAFQSAMVDADQAWQNWIASVTGARRGKAIAQPRFKRKNRSPDSFRIHHNVQCPTIRPDGYRRISVPRLGSLRLHGSNKRLCRALKQGAVVQSITVSRGGHRWYASVLTKQTIALPGPSRRQLSAGVVGVDAGVLHLAALSTGETIANPRYLQASSRRLAAAQRALARAEKGSRRRQRAARRVGRVHHEIAERRATTLHSLTKRLATEWATVAIEDLHVAGMTRSARGTLDNPGTNVRAKAGLNRALLDTAPGEVRRLLTYKTRWYGSRLAVCNRWFPSTKTCSTCGTKAKLSLSDRVFNCAACGFGPIDRDVHAAINIAANAVVVASGMGETVNARRASSSPVVERRVGRAGTEAGRLSCSLSHLS